MPCRADAPACAWPSGGLQPTYFVERLAMVGMPASASFAFDANDGLAQTVVLFPDSDPALVSNLLTGIHGMAADQGQRLWRDDRRGTVLTVIPIDRGTLLLYRPAAGR